MNIKSYINKIQLNYFWDKVKNLFDSKFVDKTSDETITGGKVFKSYLSKDRTSVSGITIRHPDVIRGTNPSSEKYLSIPFLDANSDEWNDDKGSHGRLGLIENVVFTTGEIQLYLVAYKNETNSTEKTLMGLSYPVTGTPYAFCPTPDTADNSSKIATTAFVNNQIYAPIGCIMYYAGTGTPNFWKLCDGSAISRTDYAKLYSIIGTRYGSGNGSTTFNLPNLIDKFPQGNATPGTVKSAGLPNITGYQNFRLNTMHGGYGGAITRVDQGSGYSQLTSSGSGQYSTLNFNASNSNSIYGNSTTVQPPALTLRPIIRCL